MKGRPKAIPKAAPRLLESQVQEQIVEGLRALGYEVLVTSARSVRQGYGADHGVPDLLVSLPGRSWWVGLEVKRPGPVKWSHAKQRDLWERGKTAVVRSFEDACFAMYWCSPAGDGLHPEIARIGRKLDAQRRQGVIFDAD